MCLDKIIIITQKKRLIIKSRLIIIKEIEIGGFQMDVYQ